MDGSYAPHGTNASPLLPQRDLIKKVVQECVCPFVLFKKVVQECVCPFVFCNPFSL